MEEYVIDVRQVSKMYQIYNSPQDRLKQSLWLGKRQFYKEFWALHDVSLQLKQGETIGIIGKNGSGKSTLLQILAGVLTPTCGTAKVIGRIAAMLELGSGFNPEMTGRENAYFNGAILGISREEIARRMPEIEAFAEIGEFMDQPVRLYSSGMFVRLAFACAVSVDPDILIVDEALSVGDTYFQLKCINKMKAFKAAGKTILYVSHDLYSVRNFCDKVIWLMHGRIHRQGDVQTITEEYNDFMQPKVITVTDETMNSGRLTNREEPESGRKKLVTIEKVAFYQQKQQQQSEFAFGDPFSVEVTYQVHQKVAGLIGGIAIYDKQATYVCGLNTKLDHYPLEEEVGTHKLWLHYKDIKLLAGTYFLDVAFFESSGIVLLDHRKRMDSFKVKSDGAYIAEGVCLLPHQWECSK